MSDPFSLISLLVSLLDLLTPNNIYSSGGNTTLDPREYEVCRPKEIGVREKGWFPGIIHERNHLRERKREDYWSMIEDENEYYWKVYRRYPDGSTEAFEVEEDNINTR